MKVLGAAAAGAVFLLALLTFVFWWGWLRAPSPEAVCAHVVEVMAGELGDRVDPFRRECLRSAQPPQFGRLAYAKALNCVVASRTSEQLKACRAGL